MATVASPSADAQVRENGDSLPTPSEVESPSLAKSNDIAMQQNALAGDPMSIDSGVAPSTNPDAADAPPDLQPDSQPESLPPADAPTPVVEMDNAASASDASHQPIVTPAVDVPAGLDAAPNVVSEPAAELKVNGNVEFPPREDASVAVQDTTPQDAVPDESAPVASPAPAGLPLTEDQDPFGSDSAAAPLDASSPAVPLSSEEASAPTKVAREREEDNDTEEPAAKRTKTDEDMQTEGASSSETAPVATAAQDVPPAASSTPIEPQAPQALPSSSQTRQDWGDMTEVQHKRLLEGMRNLKKGKHASLFSKPVDYKHMNLPTYLDIVKQPMDLSTMENKLKNREYGSVADYVADFDLMVNNAIRFNGQQHPVAQSGMMIRSQLDAQLRKLPKPGDPVPEPPQKPKRVSLPGPAREVSRREPRQSLGNNVTSPATPFAPDANGVPLARRDSNLADRPKRKIQRPPQREIQYPKVQKKKYKAELQFAGEVLTEMERARYKAFSTPFLNPVDPVALGIPNYRQIIKQPIDVSTIRQKWNETQYENFKEFEADFRLMFKNCYKYNPDGHAVNAMGHQYEQIFDEQVAKKSDRIKALAPASARESPDDDDEEEEEDSSDEEEEITEQQKQLAALNKQLQLLSEQASRLMSQGAGKAGKAFKDKKGKSGKADSGKKKKGSGVGVAAPSKEKKSKPAAKAKAKPITQKDKEEIASRIFELPTEEITLVAEKIKQAIRKRGGTVPDESEMEFNIDEIPDEILQDILKKLRTIDSRAAGAAVVSKDDDTDYDTKRDSSSYAPKAKRNRPLSRTDTANQMAAIQQQIDRFNGGGGAAAESPPAKESSDDDSGSESEEE